MNTSSSHAAAAADHDASTAKRVKPRRARRPCDACRRRKTRCIVPPGERSCVACTSRRDACTFDLKPPSRPSRHVRVSQDGQSRSTEIPSMALNQTPSRSPFVPLAPLNREGSVAHLEPAHATSIPAAGNTNSPLTETGMDSSRPYEISNVLYGSSSGSNGCKDGDSLGLGKSTFAELYGLSSDMEPILMVNASSHVSQIDNSWLTHSDFPIAPPSIR